ncbi:alkylhydroperoxidase domain protein [Carnimonas bestiolae]|uniref:alkylhydroperoxidase domain protein n=1 Tax=Carnimonas bestiolae TaxID=3402172 RepID=UPI003EDCA609
MSDDILDLLCSEQHSSSLAFAREIRSGVTQHTQRAFNLLFRTQSHHPSRALRFKIAEKVARVEQRPELEHWYRDHAPSEAPAESEHQCNEVYRFAERIIASPIEGEASYINALSEAGLSDDEIVTVAQLVGFVSFQCRLLTGMKLLQGVGRTERSEPPVAGRWLRHSTTQRGSSAPTRFTREQLAWEPWLAPRSSEDFSKEEWESLSHHGQTGSLYFRLLGRNMPVLEQRTLIDRGIFYTPGGLPRGERELAATVTSRVNGCIYCASVHSRKAVHFLKREDVVDKLLSVAEGGVLSTGQDSRTAAIIDFAGAHSMAPSQASLDDIKRLKDAGLDTLELLDLVQSTAFFSWANRLMLTLGEPRTLQ